MLIKSSDKYNWTDPLFLNVFEILFHEGNIVPVEAGNLIKRRF